MRTGVRMYWVGLGVVLACVCGGVRVEGAEIRGVYTIHCVGCHGADGKGKTPMGRKVGAKDLTQSKTADKELELQIREGKKDEKGATLMPGFKAKLREDEIRGLVEYVKGMRKAG